MNNLRSAIDILFRNVCPDKVIQESLIGKWEGIDRDNFTEKASSLLGHYSHNEIQNLFQKLLDDWAKDKDRDSDEKKIFNLLNNFTRIVLTEERGVPKVNYEHLLRWRELSHTLGEDIFTCNFLAYKDLKYGKNRSYFAWRPVIDSTNTRLKQLLSRGLAENHFHLNGSAPHDQLSWIVLMNHIQDRLPQFKELLKTGLQEDSRNENNAEEYCLYFLMLKAAVIRLKLFSILKGRQYLFYSDKPKEDYSLDDQYFKQLMREDSSKSTGLFLASQITQIQDQIDSYRNEFAHQIHDRLGYYRIDYALTGSLGLNDRNASSENLILSGERWFLYMMFKRLKLKAKGDILHNYRHFFYAYLLIKEKFREELIQVNKRVGFANFDLYQGRKEIFIEENKFLKKALHSMAVRTSSTNQSIQALESRISPKNSHNALYRAIQKTSLNIQKPLNIDAPDSINLFLKGEQQVDSIDENHFHVLHFIKRRDKNLEKGNSLTGMMQPRDAALRRDIKKQAIALFELREKGVTEAEKIYGIDAAASEFDARPEAFATAYRFLKNHQPQNDDALHFDYSKIPNLRATFHAGEDFFDIVDGLRTIDEAVKFLELGQGDRLGHALALGIDVEDYYNKKHCQLMIPKQVVLDNYSWLMSRLVKYGLNEFSALEGRIKHDFRVLFKELYKNNNLSSDPIFYYQAWTLRGDDPELYVTGEYEKKNPFTNWDCFVTNKSYCKEVYRDDKAVVDLLVSYHFDQDVKNNGKEIKRFDIPDDYIKAVSAIQKEMQKEIMQRHIAIECNPSSNVLIGTFKRYDKHPIVNFFNLGLTNNPHEIDNCPQLMVSINTDDQGVFNTYLENEYALMALALEKAKDENGNPKYNPSMIYDWLERIRQMGLEMSFKNIGE